MSDQIVVYDLKLKRPGCALLQAAMGGTVSATLFPTEDWLLEPTPDLAAYRISDDQLKALVTYHGRR